MSSPLDGKISAIPPRDDEKPFRIRPPRKPRGVSNKKEVQVWCAAFRKVGRLIQMGRRAGRRMAAAGRSSSARGPRTHMQRCSVRVTYSKNKTPGQWKAHGRYIERESATTNAGEKGSGFNEQSSNVDLAITLDSWQKAGDERFFKLIISPEFGDQLDLERHTRALIARMEKDLGTKLEWVAAAHFNTDHPHVHIALRGRTDRGQALHLDRSYIKSGIRKHAAELATNQIGYRTETQVVDAQKKEVPQHRYTSLDQLISRQQQPRNDGFFEIRQQLPMTPALLDTPEQEKARLIVARLRNLETMGLASRINNELWVVRQDFEQTLRAMQKAQDRQKLLAKHGALSSDQRLPVQLTSPRDFTRLEGRVLVHDEEDRGRAYMLLEGTDGKIHLIYHNDSISAERASGKMRPGNFVVLQKAFVDRRPLLEIEDLGPADAILSNNQLLRNVARSRIQQGLTEDGRQGWGGWLGQYQAAVHQSMEAEKRGRPRSGRGS